MEYEVQNTDTIEGIAASHDCTVGELVKLNRLRSRMVFPGQKLKVPTPLPPSAITTTTSSPSTKKSAPHRPSFDENFFYHAEQDKVELLPRPKPPGVAVRQGSTVSAGDPVTATGGSVQSRSSLSDDTECLRRFLKVKVKQVTESDGTVTGTLLITPATVMFDPDLHHPLVVENGPDLYGMVTNMDDIVSVSVYKHDHSLVEDTSTSGLSVDDNSARPAFDVGSPNIGDAFNNSIDSSNDVFSDAEAAPGDEASHSPPTASLSRSSEQVLPSIEEEGGGKPTPTTELAPNNSLDVAGFAKKRAASDTAVAAESESEGGDEASGCQERARTHSDLQPSTSLDSQERNRSPFSRFSPNVTRRSFGRLGRTLSSRANSIKGTVTSATTTVASGVASGTQKVAHGVVTHTKSAAASIQTGAKVVAHVPTNLVSVGSGLLQEGQDFCGSVIAELKGDVHNNKTPQAMKRDKSLATLQDLRLKTQEARATSMAQNREQLFASLVEERPDLFPPMESMVGGAPVIGTPPDPPYYMTIRLDRKRMTKKKINYDDALGGNTHRHSSVTSTATDDNAFGNKRRCEFWFAIPRTSAEAIYHFLLIWSPGNPHNDEIEAPTDSATESGPEKVTDKKGLVVLTATDDPKLVGGGRLESDCWFSAAFGSGLIRDWEIITVREACRRLSLEDEVVVAELPDGSKQSAILDEFMIRQIAEVLPPRAEGYPWVLIYNSEKHGFSLATLYRTMERWIDEMSPILIVIRDVRGHVFGSMLSSALHPSDHYYGTADACFLFRFTGKVPHTRELRHYEWTGDNQFFINSTREFLSIGAGQGHSGLWIDADLNHGRSQRCATFNNEPLAGGQEEDFVIQFVEVFGFSM